MATFAITCEGTDSLRTKGKCTKKLGTLELPKGVDPKRALTGYLCEACGKAHTEARAREPVPESRFQVAVRAAVDKALKERGL
jgi:hypothetical protein